MSNANIIGTLLGAGSLFLFGLYQIYAPTYLGRDTALAPILTDVPETVEELATEQGDIKSKLQTVEKNVDEVQHQQQTQMQVQRAQARANDQMNHERVDRYLLENGVEPNEFLRGDEMVGYANWEDGDDSEGDSTEGPMESVSDE